MSGIIAKLTDRRTMSGERTVAEYTEIWLEAFPQAQIKGKPFWAMRLRELEEGAATGGKENERQGKIAALEILLRSDI